MEDRASITVDPNVTLFTGDIVIAGCGGDRWENILVQSGAIYRMRNTKIRDATTAIELQDQSVLNAFRGRSLSLTAGTDGRLDRNGLRGGLYVWTLLRNGRRVQGGRLVLR